MQQLTRTSFLVKPLTAKQSYFCKLAFLLLAMALLCGCTQLRSHNELMSPVISARNNYNTHAALKYLQSALSSAEQNELLYELELGELLRESQQYEASTQIWMEADEQIRAWEQTAMWSPRKLWAYLGASTVSERFKPYEGQDYEKTWLLTRIALNHLAMDDWESVRVDIKRMHEREEVIANFRAAELAAVRHEAQKNGWNLTDEELGGYPVDYVHAPEVLALHNSYQNAFSHYLAGFVYEALNEPSLAAPGYRKAIELRPDSPVLEEGLRGLEARLKLAHSTQAQETDVLFIVESGDAPVRVPVEVTIPVPIEDSDGYIHTILVPIAFPTVRPAAVPEAGTVRLGRHLFMTSPVVDLNAMARRALYDEMPGLLFRGMTRAASKGALQYYAHEYGGELLGLFSAVFSVATEKADDRIWRTLPGAVAIGRGYLAPGQYPLIVNGTHTGQTIDIQGRYAVVPIRINRRQVLVGKVATYGLLPSSNATP
ncbi:MAG: hypothetical protein MESAZ_02500 [Saezia sanguinis]